MSRNPTYPLGAWRLSRASSLLCGARVAMRRHCHPVRFIPLMRAGHRASFLPALAVACDSMAGLMQLARPPMRCRAFLRGS